MADGSIWPDFLTNMFGGGGGTPSGSNIWGGSGNLGGQDPAAASLAAGGPPLAPGMSAQDLSGLNSLNQGSLWDQFQKNLKGGAGDESLGDAMKALPGAPAPRQNLAPAPASAYHIPVQNPYHSQYQPPVLGGTSAPGGWKEALLRFQRGY